MTTRSEYKHLIQFVDHENGERSQVFHCTLEELREELEKNHEVDHDDYLLIVFTEVTDETGETTGKVPRAPLLKISTFLGLDQKEKAANG